MTVLTVDAAARKPRTPYRLLCSFRDVHSCRGQRYVIYTAIRFRSFFRRIRRQKSVFVRDDFAVAAVSAVVFHAESAETRCFLVRPHRVPSVFKKHDRCTRTVVRAPYEHAFVKNTPGNIAPPTANESLCAPQPLRTWPGGNDNNNKMRARR